MLLGLAIGMALADSSVVTLALPDVLREFDVEITTVAWVLTSYNLVLALLAVPAAIMARRRPVLTFVVGTLVFSAASLACGLAPSFETLVAARCVQAAGGALVITAALDLLRATEGSAARAIRIWVAAGVLGAAIGPASAVSSRRRSAGNGSSCSRRRLRSSRWSRCVAPRGAAAPSRSLPDGRTSPPTSGCCSCRVVSSRRCFSSCCCSWTAGGCRRRPPVSS